MPLKFLATKSLRNVIDVAWRLVDNETRAYLRDFIMAKMIEWSSDADTDTDAHLLGAINAALVALLKQEWSQLFPNIVTELIESAEMSLSLSPNNTSTIRLFREGSLTYGRQIELAEALRAHVSAACEFIETVQSGTDDDALVRERLKLLKYFVKWLEPGALLQSPMFEALCSTFLPHLDFVSDVLCLFGEIFELPESFEVVVPGVFQAIVDAAAPLIPDNKKTITSDPHFWKVLAMTLFVFLNRFGGLLEVDPLIPTVRTAIGWMPDLSAITDYETFKICCDFWRSIAGRLKRGNDNPAFSAT
jgi:hypothetical protein